MKPKRTFGLYQHKKTLLDRRKRGAKIGNANMALTGLRTLKELGLLK